MKDQNRGSQPENHSAGRQGNEGLRGQQQGGRVHSGHWPGTARSRSGDGENKEGRRHASFIPLDKDDIY